MQISVAGALRSPDAVAWIRAMDREKLKLEIQRTWRSLTDEERKQNKKVIPIAIILTRKRDKSYKARAVCLGNQLANDGSVNVFSPVISHAATRYLLTELTANGDEMIPFDIDCAFLNAVLKEEEKVFVKLPKTWVKENQESVFRLVKALYGLPQAPRRWFETYAKGLRSLGWQDCKHEAGLWRKPSKAVPGTQLKLGVYVDDNVASGPNPQELQHEVTTIMAKFPGRLIPHVSKGEWKMWDILGADFWHCRRLKSMKLTMETFITKLGKKHGYDIEAQDFKTVETPAFSESALAKETNSKEIDFDYRGLIGSLGWAVTVARPDCAQPVSVLARYSSKKPTRVMVNAARKVLRYLVSTRSRGIGYTPSRERHFKEVYGDLMKDEKAALPAWNVFSDASFASCVVTFRSTSGTVCYYRSVPAVWRSARQTMMTYSTSESEYVAASDSITVSESVGFKEFFKPLTDWRLWIDNQSAVTIAQSEDFKPRSRHYALRHIKVREFAKHVEFCPTTAQCADALTKTECTASQRDLVQVFHVAARPGGTDDDDVWVEEELEFALVDVCQDL